MTGTTTAVLRGILVLGVLGYLAGLGGTLMVLALLGVLLGAASLTGRPSPPKKRSVIAAPRRRTSAQVQAGEMTDGDVNDLDACCSAC